MPSVVIGLKQASYSQKLVLACPLVMKTNPKVMSLFEMQASQSGGVFAPGTDVGNLLSAFLAL